MLLQLIVDGLALGAIYALVALGFVVIYRASQVFNFAQGEFLGFGAFTMWSLGEAGVPWGIALVLSVLGAGLLAASVERVFLRPLVGRPVFVTIIVTIFIGLILHILMLAFWGAGEKGMTPTPWDADATVRLVSGSTTGKTNVNQATSLELTVNLKIPGPQANSIVALREPAKIQDLVEIEPVVGPEVLQKLRPFLSLEGPTDYEDRAPIEVNFGAVVAIGSTVLVLLMFFLLMKFTRMGVAMRATSADQETALALGIPVGRVFGFSWFLAGAMAGLGGIFLGMYPNVVEINLAYVAMAAFPAAVIGGLESGLGAVVAGFALGILEQLASYYVEPQLGAFGPGFAHVFPYVVMIVFLVVRPYGLFGNREVERI